MHGRVEGRVVILVCRLFGHEENSILEA